MLLVGVVNTHGKSIKAEDVMHIEQPITWHYTWYTYYILDHRQKCERTTQLLFYSTGGDINPVHTAVCIHCACGFNVSGSKILQPALIHFRNGDERKRAWRHPSRDVALYGRVHGGHDRDRSACQVKGHPVTWPTKSSHLCQGELGRDSIRHKHPPDTCRLVVPVDMFIRPMT